MALRVAAQLEEKFAAIVSHGIDRVDQAHAGFVVEVGAISDVFLEHQKIAVKIGLRDQCDEFLLGCGAAGVGAQDQRCAGAVGKLEDAELFVLERRGRWWRWSGWS